MRRQFAEIYGAEQAARARLAVAPGRVNLIGEHTDYNEGFVFPMAIQFAVRLMGAPRRDARVRVSALDLDDSVEFDLADGSRDPVHPWSDYLRGVLWALREAGYGIGGMDIALAGDVPQGAGLSSSAAYEVAAATLARELFALDLPDLDLIRLCQRAESEFVGLKCGIMDQFISRMGRAGQALLLDCRDLSYSYHPLDPARASLVVINSGVKHALVDSEYNKRRRECEAGVTILRRHHPGVSALRDATPEMLAAHREEMGPVTARRCLHVVEEDARTTAAAAALDAGDFEEFGRLMYASHASLRDLYEVSCVETDLLVDLAREAPGAIGARMIGGGFGGCTVNLVTPGREEEFIAHVAATYAQRTGRHPEVYRCTPGDGARILD